MDMVSWEQIRSIETLKLLTKKPISKLQLLKYAGASQDFNLIHVDKETANEVGLPSVIAHGMLTMGFLGEYMTKTVGRFGFVKRLKVKFLKMTFVNDVLVCKGTVKHINDSEKTVDIDLEVVNQSGDLLTKGDATLQYF